MKKYRYLIILISVICGFFMFSTNKVKAASVIVTSDEKVFEETINSITIYSNGKIEFKYKYGLRKADLYYCEKGEYCDNDIYYVKNIVDSTLEDPHKNTEEGLATYEYLLNLSKDKEYKIRVEAYFAKSSSYVGGESIYGYPIGALQIANAGDNYFDGVYNPSDTSIGNDGINKLMDKIVAIVNYVLLPLIYTATSIFLVVKGAILGVQIVKSADNIDIRREKIGALKWLVIGVAITYTATTLVGVVTGFFKDVFKISL